MTMLYVFVHPFTFHQKQFIFFTFVNTAQVNVQSTLLKDDNNVPFERLCYQKDNCHGNI